MRGLGQGPRQRILRRPSYPLLDVSDSRIGRSSDIHAVPFWDFLSCNLFDSFPGSSTP